MAMPEKDYDLLPRLYPGGHFVGHGPWNFRRPGQAQSATHFFARTILNPLKNRDRQRFAAENGGKRRFPWRIGLRSSSRAAPGGDELTFPPVKPHNPLKSPDSNEGIQGNPNRIRAVPSHNPGHAA
jgi:hypothetical protein